MKTATKYIPAGNFSSILKVLHPVQQATAKELALEQEVADLKKENELLKRLC